MTSRIIDTEDFFDADSLVDAINKFVERARKESKRTPVLYVQSEGFYITGKVKLEEQTLTDDSICYNIILADDDETALDDEDESP